MGQQRVFETKTAILTKVPVIIGLMGPSASGKTFSMLRLATGIQKVTGGDIHVIDTEAKRALHYSKRFKFQHTPFVAPFSPLDYLSAIEHCVKLGAKTICIDSMSHEHEGPGGVLEMHEQEVQRLMREWKAGRGAVQFPAWAEPKAQRTRLINTILQMECNFIFCFRAKEKVKVLSRQEKEEAGTKDAIKELGWQPIGDSQFVYEMTTCAFLPPGARGVPNWQPELPDEAKFVKLPEQFLGLFRKSAPFSEAHGEVMARWASGEDVTSVIESMKTNHQSQKTLQPDLPPSDTNVTA